MIPSKLITLEQFILEKQADISTAKGGFSRVLRNIALAGKIVNKEVNRAGLADILGEHGSTNVQGEDVMKLDVFANETFASVLFAGEEVAAVISEEEDDIRHCPGNCANTAKYIVSIDPLDGSSNIDVNAPIGTIFGIYRRKSSDCPVTAEDCLQPGTELLASGYIIYGSSTMLVYTTGDGVNGFTLDPAIGEFCLSHPDIKTPVAGKIYSLNEGNANEFPDGVQSYIAWCKETDKASGRPYSARYIGSMVGDFHRNLIKGGIFIYPPTEKAPKGKLRLVYELNPMSFLMEQAGGKATNGQSRILEMIPTELHQRAPVFIGSAAMVDEVMQRMN